MVPVAATPLLVLVELPDVRERLEEEEEEDEDVRVAEDAVSEVLD